MKIICFRGKGRTGKSIVIKRILNEFFKIEIISSRNDFSLIFNYNNFKIGICSYGDTESLLRRYLKPLKDKGCDIIIYACHGRGKTITFITNEFWGHNIEYIDCLKFNEQDRQNEENNRRIALFREKFERMINSV